MNRFSAPRHGTYRDFVRDTWKDAVDKKIGPVIFVSGRDGFDLEEESRRHGDILQFDFEDSYRNLTMKMMGKKSCRFIIGSVIMKILCSLELFYRKLVF